MTWTLEEAQAFAMDTGHNAKQTNMVESVEYSLLHRTF